MRLEVLPISVVVPAYRRPEMVERAIRSVLAQRPRPGELLVVDDCSGDDTGERARALGARVITHERNQGEGAARNTGLAAAAHDWVALLDCDDEWLPGHLQMLWAVRDDHLVVGAAALGCGTESRDHRIYGWPGPGSRLLRGPADVVIPENKFVPSAVMLRRKASLAAGGFRTGMPRAADLDMWVRLLEQGTGLAIPRVTALYHIHGGQVSSDPAQMWQAHRTVLDAYSGRPWRTASVLRRHEGVVAWDEARAALLRGEPKISVIRVLARRLAVYDRVRGVGALLGGRYRARRLAARLGPSGGPSLALLPDAQPQQPLPPGTVDLRHRSMTGALLHLVRRPTAQVLTHSRSMLLVLRLMGITSAQVARQ